MSRREEVKGYKHYGPNPPGLNDLPQIKSLKDAEKWIGILHRRSVWDAQRLTEHYEILDWLAKPWWKRLFRKPPKSY